MLRAEFQRPPCRVPGLHRTQVVQKIVHGCPRTFFHQAGNPWNQKRPGSKRQNHDPVIEVGIVSEEDSKEHDEEQKHASDEPDQEVSHPCHPAQFARHMDFVRGQLNVQFGESKERTLPGISQSRPGQFKFSLALVVDTESQLREDGDNEFAHL